MVRPGNVNAVMVTIASRDPSRVSVPDLIDTIGPREDAPCAVAALNSQPCTGGEVAIYAWVFPKGTGFPLRR